MTRLTKILLIVVGLVGLVLIIRLWSGTDRSIQVFCRDIRRGRTGRRPGVEFVLNQNYHLSTVKVVHADGKEEATVWELEAANGRSEPVDRFVYGEQIPGMRSSALKAPSLEPETVYRLVITAGARGGEIDFTAP